MAVPHTVARWVAPPCVALRAVSPSAGHMAAPRLAGLMVEPRIVRRVVHIMAAQFIAEVPTTAGPASRPA